MTEEPIINNFESPPENVLEIGKLKLASPFETMKSLIDFAKKILEDKTIRNYLEEIKIKENLDKGGTYLG